MTRVEAQEAEKRIKGWSRAKKLALIRGDWDAVSFHAKSKCNPSTGSGQAEIAVSARIRDQLLKSAHSSHPEECCGLLLGNSDTITVAVPTTNVHAQRETHFEIDPVALITAHKTERDGGPQIIGYYHSHPLGPPEPSATDRAMAAHDGKIWAIIGEGQIKFWHDLPDGFQPLS